MEIDLTSMSEETFLSYANWAQEQGIWNGREVTLENFSEFSEALRARIEFLIRTQALPDPELYQLTARLALTGADPDEHAEILEDLKEMGLLSDGTLIQQAGFSKNLSKFWKKHKVKILIGVGVAAVVTAVAIVAITSAGTASGAAVAAGGVALDGLKDSKDDAKPKTSPPEPKKIKPNVAQNELYPCITLPLESPSISLPRIETFSNPPLPPPPPIESFRPILSEFRLTFPQENPFKSIKKEFSFQETNKILEFSMENPFLNPSMPQSLDWVKDKRF